MHHIDFTFMAKLTWERLESMFANKFTNSEVFLKLKLKFYNMKMNDDEELSDH